MQLQARKYGETFPVEKTTGVVPAKAGLADRTNCVFIGTSVRSGMAQMLTMLGLTGLYVAVTELAKSYFYSRLENSIA